MTNKKSECCKVELTKGDCRLCLGTGKSDNSNYFSEPCYSCLGTGIRVYCSACGKYID